MGGAMRIALHDADKTGFPNLALLKLAAHHRAQGDSVEWFTPAPVFEGEPNDIKNFNGKML